ncbi:MAG: PQQ-binding-like beta-propeller repeat protein, partial [Solirubrobacterales bacterium]|nr:PQQ-binding-like beta-propeller repeat protein [Solirubrobacterales bacterium]
MRRRGWVAVVLAALGLAAPSAHADSVSYLSNPRHDGVAGGVPEPPLGIRWARDFDARVSFPVVAEGMAFVTVRNPSDGPYGTVVHALDLQTGAERWTRTLSGTYYWSALAYDAGRLFAINFDGVLTALRAADGSTAWARQLPGQYAASSAPVARDGLVHLSVAGSGGTLYAMREGDGSLAWTQPVTNGDDSSPAVDDARVYTTYACDHTSAFDRTTGTPAWSHAGPCSGGGGAPSLLHARRLFTVESDGLVFDAASGGTVGTIQSTQPPAAADGTVYLTQGQRLRAEDATSGVERWTAPFTYEVSTQPLVAGGTLYFGSAGGALVALDRASGRTTWCTATGHGVVGGNNASFAPPSALGGGGGLLLVPAEDTLIAYGSGGAAAPGCGGSGSGTGTTPAPGGTGTTAPVTGGGAVAAGP